MSATSEEPARTPATSDALGRTIVVGPSVGLIEETLREAVASGDLQHAVSILMREYGDAVFTRARRLVMDRHLAKDVLQQTFLEAYRDLRSFGGRSSFKSWLLGIATHRALDVVRQRRREETRTVSDQILLATTDESATIEPALMDQPLRLRALEECLRALSSEVRAAVLMRFQEGMSYEEIARVSGDKPGTLHARVTRSLPVLRRCLEEKGMSP